MGHPLVRALAVTSSTRGVLLFIGLVSMTVAMGFTGTVARAGVPEPSLQRDLIALTNVDRTSNGLPALREDTRLVPIAIERSSDMLDRNYFSHSIPPSGIKVFELIKQQSIAYAIAGENLAWNNAALSATAQFAQKDFMNSPTHRANILNGAYTVIGVGAVVGSNKQMFTVLFMDPAPAPAPPAPSAAPPAPPPDAQASGTQEGSAPPPSPPVADQLVAEAGQFSEEDLALLGPIDQVVDSVIGRSLHLPGAE